VEEIVKTAWARAATRGEGPKLIMAKVNEVHEELHQWDKEVLEYMLVYFRRTQINLKAHK
jgi:hypothetical protein